MTAILERYDRLAGAFAAKVGSVPADRWDGPSPCEGWTARDVVRHVVDTHGIFLGLVGRQMGPVPPVDDDPAAAFAAASAAVRAGLADPARASASYEGAFGPSTFEASVDRFIGFDLLVHGWDLARATGLDERMDPAEVHALLDASAAFGDALRAPGVCGPALDPPDGSGEQTRLLAFLGRRSW